MIKHPHPSGRPIRRVEKKQRRTVWDYPAETFATPKLRPRWKPPPADAIGFREIAPIESGWPGQWGFIDFDRERKSRI